MAQYYSGIDLINSTYFYVVDKITVFLDIVFCTFYSQIPINLCNIFQYLKDANLITDGCIVNPKEARKNDLLVVHTKKYLKSLKVSSFLFL